MGGIAGGDGVGGQEGCKISRSLGLPRKQQSLSRPLLYAGGVFPFVEGAATLQLMRSYEAAYFN